MYVCMYLAVKARIDQDIREDKERTKAVITAVTEVHTFICIMFYMFIISIFCVYIGS